MKLNIECESIRVDTEYTLEQNGLISLLSEFNNKGIVNLDQLIGPNDSHNFINILKQLAQKNIFKLNETNENNSLVINVVNGQLNSGVKLVNLSKNRKIQMCYQLNDLKLKTITERSNDAKSFKFNLVNICFENYTHRKLPVSEVNSQADFLNFMYAVTPFEVILSQGKQLTRRDFEEVFELINYYDFDLAMINFAIDYAITKSHYHNLSYEFVRVLLDSWKKHKLSDVNSAVELVKLQEQASKKKGQRFVDPTYKQPEAKASNSAPVENVNLNKMFSEDDSFE